MTPLSPPLIMANVPFAGACLAAGNLFLNTEFLVTVGLLVGVLLLGAVVIHYLDQWRNKQLKNDDDSPLTLSNYRQLYERGELSEEEYVKVRDRLAAKMKQGKPGGVKHPELTAAEGELPKTPDPKNEQS